MNDPRILAKYGCTPERLREIFTSTGPDKSTDGIPNSGGNSPQESLTTRGTRLIPNNKRLDDPQSGDELREADCKRKENWEIRRRFEERIRSRTLAGIGVGITNSRPLQAVDMAWDAPPIQKETYPLMLWAQGKIKNGDELCNLLTSTCSPETAKKFVKKQPDGKMIVDVPRICDFSINLVRSYVTRRHAALAALWDNLWPLLKYDPRGTDEKANLLADAVTQRVDIIADEYNYRHFLSQCDRDKLLYAQSLIFPRSAWDRQTSVRWKKGADGKPSDEAESYVTQEGLDLTNPHPSRWFYDLSAPLPNVNTNTGPRWLGYWGITTFGAVKDTPGYYNTDTIVASDAWYQIIQRESWYFSQYFNPCVLAPIPLGTGGNPANGNDRQYSIGLYTGELRDSGVLVTEYFEKINPKVEGIGDYDAEVWLRLTAAGDGTVIAAEFMPSIPACYGGINVNDNRLAAASLAMEMLSFQDMASNIISQMIQQVRLSFIALMLIDTDSLDPEIVKDLKSQGTNMEWWMDLKVLGYSATKLKELGIQDPSQAFRIIQANVGATVSQAIQALAQVLALADRVVNSSPNELGQPNPREVSARETQEISTTVQSMYAFYNEGPREQRAAFKRMLYESLMCRGSQQFEVPVLGRYRKETVEAAGFTLVSKVEGAPDTLLKSGVRISGDLRQLDYDYVYTSRDGAERPLNTQGAQVLQQLLVGLIGIPGVPEALGKRRLFEMLNTVSRMAGAPDEFRIEINDGEGEEMPNPEAEQGQQALAQNAQQIQQVMQAMQQLAQENVGMKQLVEELARRVGFVPQPQVPAGTVPATNSGAPAPGTPTNGGMPAGNTRANPAAILQGPN